MDEFELNISDIPKICRACLKEKTDMKPINAKLKLMLNSIADIKIKNGDAMPKLMCTDCFLQMDRAFIFRQLVIKSDSVLKNLFRQQSNSGKFTKDTVNIDSKDSTFYMKINNIWKNEDNAELPTILSNDPLAVTCDDRFRDHELKQVNETKLQTSLKIIGNQCPPQNSFSKEISPWNNTSATLKNEDCTKFSLILPTDVVDVMLDDNKINEESEIKSQDKLHLQSRLTDVPVTNQPQSSATIIKEEKLCDNATFSNDQKPNTKTDNNNEKPFKCKKCYLAYETSLELVKHEIVHTDGELRCRFCCQSFDTKKRLMAHEQKHLTTGTKYACNVCEKVFTKSAGLSGHMRTHPEYQPFQCEICNNRFPYNSALKIHKATHLKEMKFPCKLCDHNFTTNSELVIHMRKHNHNPVNKHLCSICGRLFERRHYLVRHLLVHSGERPYKCDICHATFTQSSSVKVHMRSHTNERPYKCKLCNKDFTQSSSLFLHIRKQHK